jgi:CRP-like cAMP-binding protein
VLYVVKRGRVRLTSDGIVLDELGEGDAFGELAMIDRRPRTATAVAAEDCELAPVDQRRFEFIIS